MKKYLKKKKKKKMQLEMRLRRNWEKMVEIDWIIKN